MIQPRCVDLFDFRKFGQHRLPRALVRSRWRRHRLQRSLTIGKASQNGTSPGAWKLKSPTTIRVNTGGSRAAMPISAPTILNFIHFLGRKAEAMYAPMHCGLPLTVDANSRDASWNYNVVWLDNCCCCIHALPPQHGHCPTDVSIGAWAKTLNPVFRQYFSHLLGTAMRL